MADANISLESKVGSNVLEWCLHLMRGKQNKNCSSCHQGLYLKINIADLSKVFACGHIKIIMILRLGDFKYKYILYSKTTCIKRPHLLGP